MHHATPALELVHFAHSHYNEKVRWALDLKAVPHTRRALLPGPHIPLVKRLTGRTTTPVVKFDDGQVLGESTQIIEALEARWPEPALIPEEPGARARVLQVVAELDAELGVATRQLFYGLLREYGEQREFLAELFGCEHGPLARRGYQEMLRLILRKIGQAYDVTQRGLAHARGVTQRWFERIATDTEATGYLVGGRFTLADLTAAALAMPVLPAMPNAPVRPARVVPEPLAKYHRAWDDHPSQAWFVRIYQTHRPPDGAARLP